MIKVTPRTKLPLKTFINNGTYQKRIKYAQDLNAKFFEKIKNKIVDNSVSPKDYYTTLKELIPSISFIIEEYESKGLFDGTKAQTVIEIDEYDRATKYILQLPYTLHKYENTPQKRIDLDKFYLAMHENFHLFASICNPKHVIKQDFNSKLEAVIYKYTMYSDLHSKFGRSEKKSWKDTLENNIEPLSISEQINFLQNCRYRLLEEHLAWNESKKYATTKVINSNHFHFEEKIKIIEKLLYKLIKKARKENKKCL